MTRIVHIIQSQTLPPLQVDRTRIGGCRVGERRHRKLVTRYSAIVQTTRLSCHRRQAVCLKIVFRDRKPELSHQQVPSELERSAECFDAALKLLAPMSFVRSFLRMYAHVTPLSPNTLRLKRLLKLPPPPRTRLRPSDA